MAMIKNEVYHFVGELVFHGFHVRNRRWGEDSQPVRGCHARGKVASDVHVNSRLDVLGGKMKRTPLAELSGGGLFGNVEPSTKRVWRRYERTRPYERLCSWESVDRTPHNLLRTHPESPCSLALCCAVIDLRFSCAAISRLWKGVSTRHRHLTIVCGPIISLGSMPISAKAQTRLHQFGKKGFPGIFVGYALYAVGGNLGKRHPAADVVKLKKVGCGRNPCSKTHRKGSFRV